ncbi:hypothetical protein [Alteromonas sp. H39]|uniref:hypothetical protein n=1 Tax=Alteromonas sp. H39 TaxID=3389876 RepID=UPI0039DFE46A
MTIEVNAFLSSMAEAVEFGREQQLQALFSQPAVFVTEGEKQVCMTEESIRDKLSKFIQIAVENECYRLSFEILQLMTLAEGTYFAQVNWQWLDHHGTVARERVSAFTLHGNDDEMSIVVCVLDAARITTEEITVS